MNRINALYAECRVLRTRQQSKRAIRLAAKKPIINQRHIYN